MKPNVKIVMKVDGEVFMEENLTLSDMEKLALLCDELGEVIDTFEQVGSSSESMAVERVEPTFRADK